MTFAIAARSRARSSASWRTTAGIIEVGPLEHMTIADFENAVATAGRIVNISSIGGKIAVPHLLPYSASKFALTGLSEGLHAELARAGIRVTTVCPGLMRTGSTYNAWFKGRHRREFAWFYIADSIPGLSMTRGARRAAPEGGDEARRGWQSVSPLIPSAITTLADRASTENNELPAGEALPSPDRA
ncbi:MAG TPA: SDR family NAD(P)-dependent oxidoreductase [Vicinamibacterales bacterium]|nr:SDR family NAD(P)-dependent oxidoreductase [Vicinamibacterales bacterium]